MPAGLPSTADITKAILAQDGSTQQGQIINYLHKYLTEYYGSDSDVNYEDLCYLLTQIRDHVWGPLPNPLLAPFLLLLNKEIPALDIKSAAEEALENLYSIVLAKLSPPSQTLKSDHIKLIQEICEDTSVSEVTIFTLNHDIAIENAFKNTAIAWADGFGNEENGVRYWNPANFAGNSRVKLFKLHGSVDWYIHKDNGAYYIGPEKYKRTTFVPDDNFPRLLIGTYNKIPAYTDNIYGELYIRFKAELLGKDLLIVSGYSFRDKGINSKILDFMRNPQKMVVVIDPNVVRVSVTAKPEMVMAWQPALQNGQLIEFNRGFKAVRWSEIGNILKHKASEI